MKFEIKNPKDNITQLVRKIGYYPLPSDNKEINCVRPLSLGGYPRFHIYLQVAKDSLLFNLHLDQKKPVYKGTSAHAGEYDSDLVQREAERIKQIIQQ